jgi:hypothetical protein
VVTISMAYGARSMVSKICGIDVAAGAVHENLKCELIEK